MTTIEAKRKELEKWIFFNENFSPKLTPNQFKQLLEFGHKIREREISLAQKEFLDKLNSLYNDYFKLRIITPTGTTLIQTILNDIEYLKQSLGEKE